MSKISISEAAKIFDVSRPTITKHLKNGKISGEKVADVWHLDRSELSRVYTKRIVKEGAKLHVDLPAAAGVDSRLLHSEIKRLEAELEVERKLSAMLELNVADLRRLLPNNVSVDAQNDKPVRKRFWLF